MKKVSTAVARQSRNISHQKLTVGLDLGDRNCWYCVLDEAGQIQMEQKVHTTAKALREVFGVLPRSRPPPPDCIEAVQTLKTAVSWLVGRLGMNAERRYMAFLKDKAARRVRVYCAKCRQIRETMPSHSWRSAFLHSS